MTRLGRAAPPVPFDWYVEPRWTVEALFDMHPMLGTVGDPCCGLGTIPDVARRRGHSVVACDLVDRGYPLLHATADFLTDASAFQYVDNLVFNPPYSYRPAIAEAFARRALDLKPATVAIIVPVTWLTGEVRFRLFSEHTPSRILYFSERPSMPPGNRIADLGKRAFRGGRIAYCWVIWTRTPAGEYHAATETSWIPPRAKAARS